MSRNLIDRDALHKKLKELPLWVVHREEYHNEGYSYDQVHFAIDKMPTVDAVQVVRCKDCRFHEQEQPGMVYCPAVVGGWVDEDWFCKGGERKEKR